MPRAIARPARLLSSRARLARHRGLRQVGAAVLLSLAVFLVLRALTAEDVAVVVAARNVPAGQTLTSADVRTISAPAHVLPTTAVTDASSVEGRRLSLPVGVGEIVTTTSTDTRGFGPLSPADRAVHVRAADPGSLGLVRAGDRVDLLAAPDGRTVAVDVRVLAVDAVETGAALGPTVTASGLVVAAPASALPSIVGAPDGVHPALRLPSGGSRR